MKRSLRGLLIIGLALGGIAIGGSASADVNHLEYRSEDVNVQFTFTPTLTLTTPGDISITVASGNKAISSISNTVVVSTNNVSGYTLSANVGCATAGSGCYNSTALSDGTHTFSMVSSTTALTSGTWGISTSSSTTVSSDFKPIALHSAASTVLNKTTNAGGTAASGYGGTANTPFVVGVYAAANQAAGSYKNKVVFTAVANS